MDSSILRLADDELETLAVFRHDLHRNPELSGREYRTSMRIREFLSALPECQIIDMPIETGVVARIPGAQAEVMLRADIDALPQTERTDVPWRSSVPNAMHACGHDLHATALCGAALLLSRMKRAGVELPTTDLVFQPAEETGTGAQMLMDAGLFDRIHPEVCFGMHNWPSVEVGKVVCREGALMAALRNFEVVVRGSGGHGSMPHLNVDPIVCAAAMVQSLQTVVSRNVDPLVAGLLSINMIEGGSPVNRVADEVRMKATVRSLSDDVLERMTERVEEIVGGTARSYGCQGEVIWGRRVPMVWNPPEMMAEAIGCVERSGCSLADAAPTLVGEDFAYYRAHVPSFFFWIGSRGPGAEVHELHAPQFLADDGAISYAAQLYAACVARG
ncbi:MAG: amidohydrolase [Olsenella sp.]|nr:amidohydrolase [Olsenella sp.]